ncbi:Hypothetical protein FKW44_003740 [Caligus rogercresseyi]|uniref:Uncharacterized protein n=1 Tax=Caligus rogercresseyi TaxID=217165 RepID=A0A7T8KM13_CALRO|nr:Hypothetical protein FKW44_003740 [Caligus rogercresseyi]
MTVYGIVGVGMSMRKEHKPKSDQMCTPHLWLVSEVHQGQSGDAHSILARKRGVHFSSSPGWTLCASGTTVHIPAGLGVAHKATTCASWLKKNVPNFWDFNTWPPTPPPEPFDYYL